MNDVEFVSIEPLSEDPVHRQRLRAAVKVHTEAARAIWGEEHMGWTEAEIVGRRRGEGYAFVDRLAERDGRPVGMSFLALPQRDNAHLAQLMLAVHPNHRRAGVGSALLDDALRTVEASGRSVVQADTEWAEGGTDEAGEAFAASRGFRPAQTTVRSVMALPADRRRLQAYADGDGVEDAAAFAIETAWDMPPEEWLDDLAVLEQRMSTDAPLGETSNDEECWGADRVAENYRWAVDAGRRSLTVVARDLSIDQLVGFTVLQVTQHDPTLAYQQDTIVLREARGHRLGLRLKAAAAVELQDRLSAVTRVRTFNADDNAHMLSVNRELGYRPEGFLRVWERRSAD